LKIINSKSTIGMKSDVLYNNVCMSSVLNFIVQP